MATTVNEKRLRKLFNAGINPTQAAVNAELEKEMKLRDMARNLIFKVFNQKLSELKMRMASFLVKPSSMDLKLDVDNFKFKRNYFDQLKFLHSDLLLPDSNMKKSLTNKPVDKITL